MTVYNVGEIYLEDLSGGTSDQLHILAQTDNIADGAVTAAKLAPAYNYRGSLTDDPTTGQVSVGVYAGRKVEGSTGYPSEMQINHYAIIEYIHVGTVYRYFRLTDTNVNATWFWDGTAYTRMVDAPYLADSLMVVGTSDNVTRTMSGNYWETLGDPLDLQASNLRRIDAEGAVIDLTDTTGNRHFNVSSPIAVEPGAVYSLSLTMRYNNGVAAFYDDGGTALTVTMANVVTPDDSNYYVFDGYKITAPEGAATLRVGYHDSASASVAVLTGYALRTNKRFHGIKWACIGDSLTDPVTTRASVKYYDYIVNGTGIGFTNLGVSGTGWYYDYNGRGNFASRIGSVPADCDVLTIFGGGNDLTHISVGTASDTTADTLMGNVYLTIQDVFTNRPDVMLGVISPTPWIQYPPYTDNNMATFVTELEKLCRMYSIPYLDLYHGSNLRPWDADFRAAYYSKDGGNGVHPDERGNARFAPAVLSFLDYLIMGVR